MTFKLAVFINTNLRGIYQQFLYSVETSGERLDGKLTREINFCSPRPVYVKGGDGAAQRMVAALNGIELATTS